MKLEQKLASMISELGTQLKQAEDTQVKIIILSIIIVSITVISITIVSIALIGIIIVSIIIIMTGAS